MDLDAIKQYRDQQAQQADAQKQDGQHEEIANSLNNLLMATMVSKDPKMAEVAQNLSDLLERIGEASASFEGSSLHLLPFSNSELARSVAELSAKIESLESNQNLQPYLEELNYQLGQIADKKSVVNVPKSEIDVKPIVRAIESQKDDKRPFEFGDYKAQDLSGDDVFQYVGFINPGGAWYIIENDIKGGTLRYKFGDKNYKANWKSHVSHSYKLLNEAIRETQT